MLTKLFAMLKTHRRIEQLSNEKLADELIEKVWSDIPIWSEKSELLDETIKRLQRKCDLCPSCFWDEPIVHPDQIDGEGRIKKHKHSCAPPKRVT